MLVLLSEDRSQLGGSRKNGVVAEVRKGPGGSQKPPLALAVSGRLGAAGAHAPRPSSGRKRPVAPAFVSEDTEARRGQAFAAGPVLVIGGAGKHPQIADNTATGLGSLLSAPEVRERNSLLPWGCVCGSGAAPTCIPIWVHHNVLWPQRAPNSSLSEPMAATLTKVT